VPVLSTGESGRDAEVKMLTTAVPSLKGGAKGQAMARCPECFTVLWSTYRAGSALRIVKVGTIEGVVGGGGRGVACGGLRPDAHIYAASACVWMDLKGERAYQGMGVKEEYWAEESLERFRTFTAGDGGGKTEGG
jgi:hypothetical protein